MELLSGESLTSRLTRTGRLAPAAACEIARQVASALEAAHHADVLHRDLKPDNIYLVPDPAMPSGERVKVLDFGLAKLGAGGHTQLQTVFGTPRYISPEQSRSATQIDRRSDIYALGCVLFELVTGRTPFDGDLRQMIERHQRATPPRAAALVPDLPCALDELIADMLAKDPAKRPQTMAAVQRALRFAAEGPAATDPPSVTARCDPPQGVPPSAAPLSAASAAHPRPPSSPPILPTRPSPSLIARSGRASTANDLSLSSPVAASRPPSSPPGELARPSPPGELARPSSCSIAPHRPSPPIALPLPPPPSPPPSPLATAPLAAGRPDGRVLVGEDPMARSPHARNAAVSGEVVVPATAIAAAALTEPDEPTLRRMLVFSMWVVGIAVGVAVALAIL